MHAIIDEVTAVPNRSVNSLTQTDTVAVHTWEKRNRNETLLLGGLPLDALSGKMQLVVH